MLSTQLRNPRQQHRMRATYLNDHLAGAAGGVALARRLEEAHRGTAMHGELKRLADEIAADRVTLQQLVRTLGLRETKYKSRAAIIMERLSRFKPNGRIRGRSPLSTLIELESLRLGVEGKAAGWRTLRELAEADQRLDISQLDALMSRAHGQATTLEELRVMAAREALAT